MNGQRQPIPGQSIDDNKRRDAACSVIQGHFALRRGISGHINQMANGASSTRLIVSRQQLAVFWALPVTRDGSGAH
ncbi:hypothetical protein E4U43_006163, partial [Claviceps pusilla]